MRRREFIAGLAGTPARPGMARAQQTDRMRQMVLMKLAEDNPQSRGPRAQNLSLRSCHGQTESPGIKL
jgi:hypothetical protein